MGCLRCARLFEDCAQAIRDILATDPTLLQPEQLNWETVAAGLIFSAARVRRQAHEFDQQILGGQADGRDP